jgi:hypothetical protein
MWFWVTISTLIFIVLMIVEEANYYFWNRYVYGPNVERKVNWKKRISTVLTLFKKKHLTDINETNREKSSQH